MANRTTPQQTRFGVPYAPHRKDLLGRVCPFCKFESVEPKGKDFETVGNSVISEHMIDNHPERV